MKAITKGFGKPAFIGINLGEDKNKVEKIAEAFGADFLCFGSDCGGVRLGILKDIKECGFEKLSDESIDKTLLLFSSLPKNQLNKALNRLRENNVDIPLKAIITQSNVAWTVNELACELEREHNLMHGGDNNG